MSIKEKSKKQKIIKAVNKLLGLSEGLLEHIVDTVLVLAIFQYEISPFSIKDNKSLVGSIGRASDRAFEKSAEINYRVIKSAIKNAIDRARKEGWLKSGLKKRGKKINLEITKAGLKRIESTLPHYDEKRRWDKRIYLITYDILEKERRKRNILRNYLKKLGCARLQASVWLTPYDPRGPLFDFINENNFKNNVIISTVGKDGMIGEENIRILMEKVYLLKEINNKYREYIEKVRTKKLTPFEKYFGFLSILEEDPQLPFPLLPADWLGRKAYRLFRKIDLKKFNIE